MEQNLSASKQKIKVLVADDHPVVRKGLQLCLARQERVKIVGEAADGDQALRMARELTPDVVLMDISMPGMNGLAVTEALAQGNAQNEGARALGAQHQGIRLPHHPGGRARVCVQRSDAGRSAPRH